MHDLHYGGSKKVAHIGHVAAWMPCCVLPPHGAAMSDGDTRKVNEKVLKDPNAQWKPFEKFRSFERIDQIWVFIGLGILIVTLNLVFGLGGNSSSIG